jgi:hypothetical protein
MRMIVVALFLAASTLAQAKEVGRFTKDDLQVRLFDEQGGCPVVATRIEMWISGVKRFDGCAVERGDEIFIQWEDGDFGVVPRKLFKPGV